MGRDLLVLSSPAMRSKAVDRIMHAPEWTRLTFQGPRRTNDQNAKLWAMLSDVAEQREHARPVDQLARVVGVVCAHAEAEGDPGPDHGRRSYHLLPWPDYSSGPMAPARTTDVTRTRAWLIAVSSRTPG